MLASLSLFLSLNIVQHISNSLYLLYWDANLFSSILFLPMNKINCSFIKDRFLLFSY